MMKFRLMKSVKKEQKEEDVNKDIAEVKKRREIKRLKREKERELKKKQKKRHKLEYYLTKAGIDLQPKIVAKRVFNIAIMLNLMMSAYVIFYFATKLGYSLTYIIIIMIVIWVFSFVLLIFILWIFLYIMIDLKILKRRLDLEAVLPDFLQLSSSNIKSGMPIDQALFYAVRPRFGVLAKEIEIVAKETMSGKDLDEALKDFAKKYDSVTLKRTVSLLVEGISAGGEIADLVMRISTDIQDTAIMKKEMAASVMTYVIFIGFATVAASPFLFGLAGQLIAIVKNLAGTMDLGSTVGGTVGISLTGGGISLADFKIFSIVMLTITSVMSAAIISTIQKGTVKEGIKYIPMFVIATVSLYLIVSWGLAKLFSGMFG